MRHFLKLQPPPAEQRLTCDIVPSGGHYSYYRVLKPKIHRNCLFISLCIILFYFFCQSGKKLTLDLTLLSLLCCFYLPGDLESFRKNPFPMKEGVEYRIKICFKVRVWRLSHSPLRSVYVAVLLLHHCWRCNCSPQSTIIIVRGFSEEFNSCCLLQVNKEIVSGLKYMQQTFRKGVKGEPAQIISLCRFFYIAVLIFLNLASHTWSPYSNY